MNKISAFIDECDGKKMSNFQSLIYNLRSLNSDAIISMLDNINSTKYIANENNRALACAIMYGLEDVVYKLLEYPIVINNIDRHETKYKTKNNDSTLIIAVSNVKENCHDKHLRIFIKLLNAYKSKDIEVKTSNKKIQNLIENTGKNAWC